MSKIVIPKNKYYFNKRNNYISDIRQGVIDLSKLIDELSIKLEIAEDRINKAIETLGKWTIFETSACTDRIISETLDILKGDDKE